MNVSESSGLVIKVIASFWLKKSSLSSVNACMSSGTWQWIPSSAIDHVLPVITIDIYFVIKKTKNMNGSQHVTSLLADGLKVWVYQNWFLILIHHILPVLPSFLSHFLCNMLQFKKYNSMSLNVIILRIFTLNNNVIKYQTVTWSRKYTRLSW